jgi:hypothetical protein
MEVNPDTKAIHGFCSKTIPTKPPAIATLHHGKNIPKPKLNNIIPSIEPKNFIQNSLIYFKDSA